MAFKHTIPPSRPDMGRWGTENTGCCFEPMRDILPTTQKHIYILFHNNHFQSKNAAWPIIENTPLVPHLKKNLFPRGTGPSVFFRSQWAAISLADSLSCCTSLVKILTRDFLIRHSRGDSFPFFRLSRQHVPFPMPHTIIQTFPCMGQNVYAWASTGIPIYSRRRSRDRSLRWHASSIICCSSLFNF